MQTLIQKDTCTPMFVAALLTIPKVWKQPKRPSTDKWIKKIIGIKKNEILPFAVTWMDLENIILNEMSQTEKDKYCMMSLICGT